MPRHQKRKRTRKNKKYQRRSKHMGVKIQRERADVDIFAFDETDLDVTELRTCLQNRLARGIENYLVLFDRGGNYLMQRFKGEKWIFFDAMDPIEGEYEHNIYIKCDITHLQTVLSNLPNCFHYITSDYDLLKFTDDVLSWMMPSLLPDGIIAFIESFAEGQLSIPHVKTNQDIMPHSLRISTGFVSRFSSMYGLISFFVKYPHPMFEPFINWFYTNEKCVTYYLYMRDPSLRRLAKVKFPTINRTSDEQLDVIEQASMLELPAPEFINCPPDEDVYNNILTVIKDMEQQYVSYCKSWTRPSYVANEPGKYYIIKK